MSTALSPEAPSPQRKLGSRFGGRKSGFPASAGMTMIWLAAQLFFLLTFPARAEEPPDRRPFLRIEAGMHTALIPKISVSADGALLATAGIDKAARLWSLPDGKLIRIFRVPVGPGEVGKVFAVALSPDGRKLVVGGWDTGYREDGDANSIYVFDTVSGAVLNRLGPLPNVTPALQFSRDGKFLAAGLFGANGIRVWRSERFGREVPYQDRNYRGSVFGLDFAPNGDLVATGEDGFVRRYDHHAFDGVSRTVRPEKLEWSAIGEPIGVAYSPDGGTIALSSFESPRISLLRSEDLKEMQRGRVDTGFAGNGELGAVAWSMDGQVLFGGGSYTPDEGERPLVAWSEAGKGKPSILGGPIDTLVDLATLPGGAVAWSSHGPSFGQASLADRLKVIHGPVNADMRGKTDGNFLVANDGQAVRFGLRKFGDEPWLFDVAKLNFFSRPEGDQDLLKPIVDGLDIANWANNDSPTLDGERIPLVVGYEPSRSLAIAPDRKSFYLGAEFSIYRFDPTGKQLWRIDVPGIAWGVNLAADGSILIAAHGDGTIRWYRAEDGKELLAFFVHTPDKRWVAWTPTGYYAASPGGEDLIGWHLNGKTWDDPVEFFPASRFRDRFYRPDIVQLVLKTKDEGRAVAEANAKAQRETEAAFERATLPPVVEIIADPRGLEAASEEIEIAYRLRAPSGREITKLELRVDGQLQEARARGFNEVADPEEGERIRVRLPARDARVSLVAFHGEQASAPAEVQVTWTGPKKEIPERNLYAVLVGVSAYEDPSLTLSYADDDARALGEALSAQEGRFFKAVEIKILTDADAGKDAITEAIAELADKGTENDYKLVFLAGHGATKGKNFYFLPYGANPTGAKLVSSGLSGSVIRENLMAMPGKVLFFIDACYSATTLGTDIVGYLLSITGEENAVMMYASSSRGEVSYERADWGHGAFTKALMDILGDPASYNARGEIMTDELGVKLREAVWALTGNQQTPIGQPSRAIEPFPVAAR